MKKRHLLYVVLVAVVAVSMTHREIAGCSCLKVDYRFLVPSGVTLPSNALGVPWAGSVRRDGERWIYPRRDLFLVQRLDSAGDWVTIDFDLHEIRGELIGDSTMYIVLVVPDDGMTPGACYPVSALDSGTVVPAVSVSLVRGSSSLSITNPSNRIQPSTYSVWGMRNVLRSRS